MATESAKDLDIELPTVEDVIRHRLSVALGGWRGSIEMSVPTIAFVAVWSWRKDVGDAVLAAGACAVLLAALRLVQRQGIQHVLSAVFTTAIAAFFALRSGRAEDAFLPGILASTGWGLGSLASVVLRWPVIGFMVGAGDPKAAEDPFGWRRDPAMVRVCQQLTLVLVGLYAVRVAIMLPLYFAGNVPLLGVAKVGLSWPAWAAALAIMGWILVRGETPQTVPTADSEETLKEHWAEHQTGARPSGSEEPTGPESRRSEVDAG